MPKKSFLNSLMEQRLQLKFFETKKFVASEVTLAKTAVESSAYRDNLKLVLMQRVQ